MHLCVNAKCGAKLLFNPLLEQKKVRAYVACSILVCIINAASYQMKDFTYFVPGAEHDVDNEGRRDGGGEVQARFGKVNAAYGIRRRGMHSSTPPPYTMHHS